MKQYPVAREGWPFLAGLTVLSVATYQVLYLWAILPTILLLYYRIFFSKPLSGGARYRGHNCGTRRWSNCQRSGAV